MKLLISPFTMYTFIIGGIISLLWCLVVLTVSLSRGQLVAGTLFTEVDVASKLPQFGQLRDVLSSLSITNSWKICRELANQILQLEIISPTKAEFSPEKDLVQTVSVETNVRSNRWQDF